MSFALSSFGTYVLLVTPILVMASVPFPLPFLSAFCFHLSKASHGIFFKDLLVHLFITLLLLSVNRPYIPTLLPFCDRFLDACLPLGVVRD